MKKLPFLIVILLLVTCVPDTSGEFVSVRITGVLPTSSFEGVEITNYGDGIDLRDYALSDGEGTVTFSSSYYLGSGQSIWILKSQPGDWFKPGNYVTIGSNGISSSKYALADKGDDIYLKHNGQTIDTFVYGEMTGSYDGWNGSAFPKMEKNSYAIRISYFDTNTAADWKLEIPGRQEIEEQSEFECKVETFVFPESKGYPIMRALAEAKSEIDISIYNLSQNDVIAILLEQIESGVTVNILCDGSPVGGINETELKALATLSDCGASVHLIKQSDDGFKRYTYLHNKYAIIDNSIVIISSENWVDSSFTGNRGWGIIANSNDYANYMKKIFLNDFDIGNADVCEYRTLYPKVKTSSYCHDDYGYEPVTFSAMLKPVMSPDNSLDSMKEFISNAKERIYSEQLDVQYSWLSSDNNPLQWMVTKGSEGVDCRLLVDTTFDSDTDEDYEDSYGLIEALEGNDSIQCKKVNGEFSVVHNKGVIVDDSVWIGSVNWTYTSFNNNRESAVIIRSKEIADYYSQYFLSDWGLDKCSIVPKITISGELRENQTFILDATGSIVNSDSIFSWDLDGDGIFERTGASIMVSFPAGHHSVKLKITDGEGNTVTEEYSFDVSGNVPIFDWKFIPLILLCAMILLIKAIKKIRERCR